MASKRSRAGSVVARSRITSVTGVDRENLPSNEARIDDRDTRVRIRAQTARLINPLLSQQEALE
jgi:hypothetical protein